MNRLKDILLRPSVRQRLIQDMAHLIDDEVRHRPGVAGLAIRGGYHVVQQVRRDFVHDALDDMLEAFINELDPLWQEHGATRGFDRYLTTHRRRVAQQMMRVTDARRQRARSGSLRRTYDRLSPVAHDNLERAIPRLGRILQHYIDEFEQAGRASCPSAA